MRNDWGKLLLSFTGISYRSILFVAQIQAIIALLFCGVTRYSLHLKLPKLKTDRGYPSRMCFWIVFLLATLNFPTSCLCGRCLVVCLFKSLVSEIGGKFGRVHFVQTSDDGNVQPLYSAHLQLVSSEYLWLRNIHGNLKNEYIYLLREDLPLKRMFTFGHCPNQGEGGGPCPKVLALFLPTINP